MELAGSWFSDNVQKPRSAPNKQYRADSRFFLRIRKGHMSVDGAVMDDALQLHGDVTELLYVLCRDGGSV